MKHSLNEIIDWVEEKEEYSIYEEEIFREQLAEILKAINPRPIDEFNGEDVPIIFDYKTEPEGFGLRVDIGPIGDVRKFVVLSNLKILFGE